MGHYEETLRWDAPATVAAIEDGTGVTVETWPRPVKHGLIGARTRAAGAGAPPDAQVSYSCGTEPDGDRRRAWFRLTVRWDG